MTAESKKCKQHPERIAKLRADGISTGCCAECLTARANASAASRAANKAKVGK